MEIASLMALVETDAQGNEKIVETAQEWIPFSRYIGLWTPQQAEEYKKLAEESGHKCRPVQFRRSDYF